MIGSEVKRQVSHADRRQVPFIGAPEHFRLGIQALWLRLAHSLRTIKRSELGPVLRLAGMPVAAPSSLATANTMTNIQTQKVLTPGLPPIEQAGLSAQNDKNDLKAKVKEIEADVDKG